jgi:hypothetical protein
VLLRAVVQVALDPAAFGVAGSDDPRARLFQIPNGRLLGRSRFPVRSASDDGED